MIAWLHATINTFSHTDLGKKNMVKYMQLIFFLEKWLSSTFYKRASSEQVTNLQSKIILKTLLQYNYELQQNS